MTKKNFKTLIKILFLCHFLQSGVFALDTEEPVQGIILTKEYKDTDTEDPISHHGVSFIGFKPPGNPKALKNLLSTLIGKPINQETIERGKKEIFQFYQKVGHPVVKIHFPKQEVRNGVLHYVVSEATIEEIDFKGHKWTSTSQLNKGIHKQVGETIDTNILEKDLIWLNRNPFRNTTMILSPGDEEGGTRLEFITDERLPVRGFVGGDNTGYDTTGRGRIFAGVIFGNLLRLDEIVSYQYTASTDWGKFYAHTGQYIVPLPWKNIIEIYGGYSGIHAIMPLKQMSSSGHAWQVSLRYVIPLTPIGAYTHEVKVGFDYKKTNVNLVLDAIPVVGNQVAISQLVCGYYASLEHKVVDTSLEFQWFVSPGGLFNHQSNKDYSTLRPDADHRYTYFRAAIIPVFHLPKKFEGALRTEFQVANRNLLSSEQFGLGGLYTIRGYDERVVNTDNAFLLSGELRSPSMRLFTKKGTPRTVEMIQALMFVDYGFGVNHKALPAARDYLYLLSTGLGLRYRYRHYAVGRLDWGIPIHRHIEKNVTQKKMLLNFSLILSY